MKIILTGATGLIGSEVLRQALKHQYITHVYAVVRKPLAPELANHPRCTEIIHENFEVWPDHLMKLFKSEGVQGCIWCIGGWVASFPDLETAQRVNIAMPQAAAEAFAQTLAPEPSFKSKSPRGDAFRFIYLSVTGAEQDQFRSLWVQAQSRKAKGAAEKGLFELADTRPKGTFEVYSLRLGKVLPGGQTAYNIVTEAATTSISVGLAAKGCITTVIDGRLESEGGRIFENADLFGEDWASVTDLAI